jgi:putative transcriptional regulator
LLVLQLLIMKTQTIHPLCPQHEPRKMIVPNGAQVKTKHDWSRLDAMTESQRHAAALADPDAQPLTPERLAGMKQTPRLKIIRRALGLTQEEFAARFQIPLGTLRDWEQGAAQPDQTARAYLRAIAGDAAAVQRALDAAPQPR